LELNFSSWLFSILRLYRVTTSASAKVLSNSLRKFLPISTSQTTTWIFVQGSLFGHATRYQGPHTGLVQRNNQFSLQFHIKICRSTLFREDLGISYLPTLLSKSRVRRPRPYHDNRVAARTPTKKPWGHFFESPSNVMPGSRMQ